MNLKTGMTVYHAEFGMGRVVHMEPQRTVINFVRKGVTYFAPEEAEEVLSDTPSENACRGEDRMDIDELKAAIRETLLEEGIIGETVIGDKWEGGQLILRPGKPGLQEKTVPIETFFHKIVMVRDRLRVLEQNINTSEKLSDADKAGLQQYITRCYGTLTTFNVLFSEKKDWFVGEKKD